MKYDADMKEDSHRALFMQQVPKSFLRLQEECLEYAEKCRDWTDPVDNQQPHPHNGRGGSVNGTALPNGTGQTETQERKDPVMNEEEFR